MTSKLKILM